MTTINSNKELIEASAEKVFGFLSNFNNFKNILPEKISDWNSDENSCNFNVNGLGYIALSIVEKQAYSKVVINSGEGAPVSFTMVFNIESSEENTCHFQIAFMAELNSIMSMMVKTPLQNFVNALAQKLKEFYS